MIGIKKVAKNTLVFRFYYLILTIFMVFSFLQANVSAQGLSQDDVNSIYNNTVWYDPTSTGNTSCSSTSDVPTGTLSSDMVASINNLKSTYMQAAAATNVPWQLLAGIHYRETSFSTTSPNIFQITGYSGSSDFLSQAIAAGNFLQTHSVPDNLPNHRTPLQQTGNDPEEIKDTIFSYNGRADAYAQQAAKLGFSSSNQPYEGSPYVMNNFDSTHQDMGIITGKSGLDTVDGTDTRDGAYTIYAALVGSDSSAGSGTASTNSAPCSGAVSGNLMQTIINYAWPDFHQAPYCTEKPAYTQAIQQAASAGKYTGGTCTIGGTWPGVDCGAFVTRVMQDSGTDPAYNSGNGNTITQQAYLDQQVGAGKYTKLSNVTGTNDLQPGDIAINSVHTYIYVGSIPGFNGDSASASFSSDGTSWRAPMASNAYDFTDFTWYRLNTGG